MRNIHSHELALVSGGIIQSPSDQLRRDLDGSEFGQQGFTLHDDAAWGSTSTSSASNLTAFRMVAIGAGIATVGFLAVAAVPFMTASALVGAAVAIRTVGTIAQVGGGAWAGFGMAQINK
jgi:hypothetical protein